MNEVIDEETISNNINKLMKIQINDIAMNFNDEDINNIVKFIFFYNNKFISREENIDIPLFIKLIYISLKNKDNYNSIMYIINKTTTFL